MFFVLKCRLSSCEPTTTVLHKLLPIATGVGAPPFAHFVGAIGKSEPLSAFASKDGSLRAPVVFEAEKAQPLSAFAFEDDALRF
jgi:hypothetical protein